MIVEYPYLVTGLFVLCTLGFSILVNRLLLKFAKGFGIRGFEKHQEIRWSEENKPSLGGLSFYMVFLTSFVAYTILASETAAKISNKEVLAFFTACTMGFIIGLADDAYNTNPRLKLLGQIICGNLLVAGDIVIVLTPVLAINYLATVFWVVLIMNAINLLDNMDGVAGGISIPILLGGLGFVLIDEKWEESSIYYFMLAGMVAGVIGFLVYNWRPARMYMGDTGSQFLGVFLAGIAILFFWNPVEKENSLFHVKQLIIPAMFFILPLIDTITVVLRRFLAGKSPFIGGRDHTTHALAVTGLGEKSVAIIFVTLSTIAGGLVFWFSNSGLKWDVWAISGFTLFWLLIFSGFQWIYKIGKRKVNK